MGFVRVMKSKAYYSRFQVKYRRRREAKTDYQARRNLIIQDKNKYNVPKYRLVVRFTNKDIICQIFAARLTHDECIESAYSHELRRYGLTVGLTNYAAAYATGLLLARRVDQKFTVGYEGTRRADGKEFHVKDDGVQRPFKALLDVGLARTTTGARIFGALKGAADGGLDVPHNTRRFPGSFKDPETSRYIYEPEEHRRYIFGQHVADYMNLLEAEDKERFQSQFSRYIANGIKATDLAVLYARAHFQIRQKPKLERGALELGAFKTRASAKVAHEGPQPTFNEPRMSLQQRKNRIAQILGAKGKTVIKRSELLVKSR